MYQVLIWPPQRLLWAVIINLQNGSKDQMARSRDDDRVVFDLFPDYGPGDLEDPFLRDHDGDPPGRSRGGRWLRLSELDWGDLAHDGCPHVGHDWLVDREAITAVTVDPRGAYLVYVRGVPRPLSVPEPVHLALDPDGDPTLA
jgi:hypothetical protein